MFGRLSDLLFNNEHRLIRDYLMLSGAVLVVATAGGAWLARVSAPVDPMFTASVPENKPKTTTHYQVRSVLDPDLRSTRLESRAGEGAADVITTGGIASSLRSTRIDPCTVETKE
jgi:hypothetical protein